MANILRGAHKPDDGRGARKVLLNGVEIKHVVYADTVRGIVRCEDDPPQLHKHGKRFIQRTKRGSVEVYYLEQN